MLRYSPAEPRDARALIQVLSKATAFPWEALLRVRRSLPSYFKDPDSDILKAVHEGNIVGYLAYRVERQTAKIDGLYVGERRRGIAAQLLDNFVSIAAKRGSNQIFPLFQPQPDDCSMKQLGFVFEDRVQARLPIAENKP